MPIVAYYPFDDDTVKDRSGANNNGTPTNITYAAGQFGRAASFNGSTSFVYFSGDADGIRTICLWFAPTNNIDNTLVTPQALLFRNGVSVNPGVDEFGLVLTSFEFPGELVFSNGQGNRIGRSIINSWTAGEWHHVAVTIDAVDGTTMYIDGVETSTDPETTPVNNFDTITALGRWGNLAIRYFPGLIDEVRVYNEALSEDQIKLLFHHNYLALLGLRTTAGDLMLSV